MKKRILLILILSGILLTSVSAQTVLGDVNSDNAIDIVDALVVAQYSVGITPSQFASQAADVDGNGTINIVDALIIAQYYVGLITKFPGSIPTPSPAPTPTPPAFDYQRTIQDWASAKGIDLTGYGMKLIQHEALGFMFPDYTFVLLYLRQYPVASGNPDAFLGLQCIMAIDKNLQITALPEESDIQGFYRSHQQPTSSVTSLQQAIKAWLALSQEDKNDGFYTFVIPDETITITLWTGDAPLSYRVTGESRVLTGGEGVIQATAFFDSNFLLASVTEEVTLIMGIRPVCQSTKLLDPDRVVRIMAEQSLLSMGASAKDYLFNQRKISPPALQEAIDHIWSRILEQEKQREKIRNILSR